MSEEVEGNGVGILWALVLSAVIWAALWWGF